MSQTSYRLRSDFGKALTSNEHRRTGILQYVSDLVDCCVPTHWSEIQSRPLGHPVQLKEAGVIVEEHRKSATDAYPIGPHNASSALRSITEHGPGNRLARSIHHIRSVIRP